MKQNRCKDIVWRGILLMGVMLFSVSTVYASERTVQISLPVKQIFTVENAGSASVDQTVDYTFEAVSENAPMPEKSQNKQYGFSMQGNQQQFDIPLSFEHGGIYTYKLSVNNKDDGGYHYDKTCYVVTVYVQNEADRLTTQVIVENGKQEKSEEIRYQHTYQASVQPNSGVGGPTKTGDSGNGMLWFGLILSCIGMLAVLMVKKSVTIQ